MAPSTTRTNGRGRNDESQVVSHARIKLSAATERGRGTNRQENRDQSPSSSAGSNSRHQLKRTRNGPEQKINGNGRENGHVGSKKSKVPSTHSPSSSKFARPSKSRRQGDEDEEVDGEQYDETEQKLQPMLVERGGSPADEEEEEQEVEDMSGVHSVHDEDDEQPDANDAQSPAENDEDVGDEPEPKAAGRKKKLISPTAGSRKSGRNAQQESSPEAARGNAKQSRQTEKSEEDGEEEGNEEEKEYAIESIEYHWVEKGKPTQFFIKWVGFEDQPTWEPEDTIQETLAYEQYCAKHDVTAKSGRQIKEQEQAAAKRKTGKAARGPAENKPKEGSPTGKRTRRAAAKKVVPDKKPLAKKSTGSVGGKPGPRRGIRQSKRTQQVVIATDWAERSRQKIEVENLKVAQIMGFSPEESVAARELVFGVRFEGEKDTHIVSNVMMKKHFPQELLTYYEQLIIASDPTFRKISADGVGGAGADGDIVIGKTTTGSPTMQTPKLSSSKIPMMPTRQTRAAKGE